MKVIIKRTFYILFSLTVLIIALISLALQSSPHIKALHQIDANFAAENKKTLQRIVKTIKSVQTTQSKKQPVLLSVTQDEIDGLSALGHRAIPQLISNIVLIKDQGFFRFSLELPLPKLIRFLNINLTLNASQTGLDLDTAYIGSIPIPGRWLITLGELVGNHYIEEEFGSSLLNTIANLEISPSSLQLSIEIPDRMHNQNKSTIASLFALRDKLALFGNVDDIRFYHQALLNFVARNDNKKSLAPYITHIFSVAKKRSRLLGAQAAEENKAALTALVLYFGTDKFELFIGDVSYYSSKQATQRLTLQRSVSLRNRVDIQKHFIYSIALQLFGNSNTSDAIGELKEFLDSNQGGSGFSFADLMADRAGTRFAMISTQSNKSALLVQAILAQTNSESAIIPALAELPEGITQQAFKKYYQDIQSTNYIAMLNHIDAQLLQTPLYRIQ
ncbi:hypothetical protein [Colwellia sp. C1TZA3]|uniref:hypothetical protein n=1 Tax=Colwellia sp. C1TZA3 TaxID=2508879 RepID=UPI0011BA40FC|nr:hypothetical protein [Colwellia sp. C1TZA3]TWX72214.1 hypothetical protein ESZ39_08960 [Colwellia sp. C1TZA3]